jgi:hypothetical protein
VATGLIINKACGIPGRLADADPSIISNFMSDIGFNSSTGDAVRRNNR